MSFYEPEQVLNALKTKLTDMVWPTGHAQAGENLFERVDVYDVPRLAVALKDLLNYKNRIALIVMTGLQHYSENAAAGLVKYHRTGTFVIIASDKDYLPGKPSLFGQAGQPGALAMSVQVTQQLIGETLPLDRAVIAPQSGDSIRVAENEKQLGKAREGYRQFYTVTMGFEKRVLSRGAKLNPDS